jgi:hypothetical protein
MWFRRSRKTVLVLQHEREISYKYEAMALGKLAACWKRDGINVVSHCGVAGAPAADVALVHVDLSVVPEEYLALARSYPASINARVADIRKRRFSELILAPGDDWDGPVIAKSDLNCGGKSELRLFSDGDVLCPFSGYPILDRLGDVPAAWWNHPHVIVEKFIPEREGGNYILRQYLFLGREELWTRLTSPEPLVKGRIVTRYEEVPPEPAVRAVREELGFDYGKFDFVIPDGRPIILDLNKTQGPGLLRFPAYVGSNERRARGILEFLGDRTRG